MFKINIEEDTQKAYCVPDNKNKEVLVFEDEYYQAFKILDKEGIINGYMYDNIENICLNYNLRIDDCIKLLRKPDTINTITVMKLEVKDSDKGIMIKEKYINKIPKITITEDNVLIEVNSNTYEYNKDIITALQQFYQTHKLDEVENIINTLYITNQQLYTSVDDVSLYLCIGIKTHIILKLKEHLVLGE